MNSAAAPNPDRNERRWFSAALALILTLALSILIFGCSPRIVEKVVTQHDTTYVEKVKVDSLIRRDSVFVKEKGDSVYVYREKVVEKYRFLRDTIVRVKVDSVAVEHVKEVKVEQPLSAWKKAKIRAFWWLLGAVVLLLVWTFRKSILKLIKL